MVPKGHQWQVTVSNHCGGTHTRVQPKGGGQQLRDVSFPLCTPPKCTFTTGRAPRTAQLQEGGDVSPSCWEAGDPSPARLVPRAPQVTTRRLRARTTHARGPLGSPECQFPMAVQWGRRGQNTVRPPRLRSPAHPGPLGSLKCHSQDTPVPRARRSSQFCSPWPPAPGERNACPT